MTSLHEFAGTEPFESRASKSVVLIGRAVWAFRDSLEPFVGIELVLVNVSRDAARSAQCIELSRSRTVPQVFLNDEHIGNANTCDVFNKCGELGRKLRALAQTPSTQFPPELKAAFVKLTDDMAFSSQPSLAQVRALAGFGFRSLVNLVHKGERCYLRSESVVATTAGISYTHIPPAHRPNIPISHIEVDLIPSRPMPAAGDLECIRGRSTTAAGAAASRECCPRATAASSGSDSKHTLEFERKAAGGAASSGSSPRQVRSQFTQRLKRPARRHSDSDAFALEAATATTSPHIPSNLPDTPGERAGRGLCSRAQDNAPGVVTRGLSTGMAAYRQCSPSSGAVAAAAKASGGRCHEIGSSDAGVLEVGGSGAFASPVLGPSVSSGPHASMVHPLTPSPMLAASAGSADTIPALATASGGQLEAIIEEEEAAAALRGVTVQTMQGRCCSRTAVAGESAATGPPSSASPAAADSSTRGPLLSRARNASGDSSGRARSASMSSAEEALRLSADAAVTHDLMPLRQQPPTTPAVSANVATHSSPTFVSRNEGGDSATTPTPAAIRQAAAASRAAKCSASSDSAPLADYAATEASSAGPSTVWTMRPDDLDGRAALVLPTRSPAGQSNGVAAKRAVGVAGDGDDDDDAGSETPSAGSTAQWKLAASALKAPSEAGSDMMDRAVWTPQWCRRVLDVLDACRKPVLVHCQTGVAACAVGLIRAGRQLKATPRQVARWGADLGHSFASHGDLEACISTLLAEHRAAAAPPALAEVDGESDGVSSLAATPEADV